MSERNHAPWPGGRAAEPPRRTTGRRDTVESRDADAQRSAARGARHFTGAVDGESADTRRSGIGQRESAARNETGTPPARGHSRETEVPRAKAPDAEGFRAQRRDAEGVRAQRRDAEGVRDRKRDAEGVRARKREAEGVRAQRRDAEGVGSGGVGAVAHRTAPATARRSRMAEAVGGRGRADRPGSPLKSGTPGGRGRRPVVDAPVDGAAALQIEVSAEPVRAESLRAVDVDRGPRLRVAPPAPISAPRATFVAAVLGVVIVGVLGILLINTKTNENSFRIADLTKQNTALNDQQQDLDNQLVVASSIGNLDAAARRLGMVKADKLALFRLPDGKVIGVPTPTDGTVAVTAQDAKTGTDDQGAANIIPLNGTQQKTAGKDAAGQTPNSQAATGQGTTGQGTTGLTLDGQGTNGLTLNGQGATGQTVDGQAGNGQAAAGQTASGQAGQTSGQTSGTGQ